MDNYRPNIRKERIRKFLKSLSEKSSNFFLRPFVYYIVGKYRFMGEIHLWLYDSHSLSTILQKNGCIEVKVQTALESFVPNWSEFKLDNPYETSSIFIEAKKA